MFDGIPEKDNYDSTGDASVVVNIVPTDVAIKSVPEELPEPVTGITRMTTTSSIDGCINDSSDSSLASGLSTTLYSVIRDFDSKAEDTFRSQDQLSFAIDRLARERMTTRNAGEQ
ncbi:hypothetical protein F0562_008620 [Nyssa sinensis]|uniref:Uncharacterized protein n=1 Tax=Nyssa sinensis TaxID=561372 RepID=A0A5J5AD91_9ASTE|nr:hypothetical protein F0562_008620 [Nyssa sinensis]